MYTLSINVAVVIKRTDRVTHAKKISQRVNQPAAGFAVIAEADVSKALNNAFQSHNDSSSNLHAPCWVEQYNDKHEHAHHEFN